MGICNVEFTTDLKNNSYTYINNECKQGDTLILTGTILDDGVKADLTGFACRLNVNKANGRGYEIRDATVTVATGTTFIKCPSSVTQFAGTLLLEVQFIDKTNKLQKTSFDIEIEVKHSVLADDVGNAPEVIITALESLTKQLNDITAKVQAAYNANTTLTSTVNTANSTNSALVSNTSKATSTNTTLVNNTTEAKNTIQALKDANGEYTQHIKNTDIHVTKTQQNNWDNHIINQDIHVTLDQKKKWDEYGAKIIELTSIIDDGFYKDAVVIDDENNTVVDDEGNTIIV